MARGTATHGFQMGGRKGSPWANDAGRRQNPKKGKKKGAKGARRRNSGWTPQADEKPVTYFNWLDAAQTFNPALKQFDAIFRHPQFVAHVEADDKLMKSFAGKGPIHFRAKARMKGWMPALTDAQHMMVIREIAESLAKK